MAEELKTNLILGVVQGVTEFLPVSSSGHLAVINYWLTGGLSISLATELILHLATLIAIVIVLYPSIVKDVTKNFKTTFVHVTLATLTTAFVAFPLKNFAEKALGMPHLVGVFFTITAIYLAISALTNPSEAGITWWKAALIGLAQGFAVLPGISRSGITIVTALLLGVNREEAFRFSFYIFIPATIGASILEVRGASIWDSNLLPLAAGFGLALSTGVISLVLLRRLTQRGKMWYFSPYLIVLGTLLWLA